MLGGDKPLLPQKGFILYDQKRRSFNRCDRIKIESN